MFGGAPRVGSARFRGADEEAESFVKLMVTFFCDGAVLRVTGGELTREGATLIEGWLLWVVCCVDITLEKRTYQLLEPGSAEFCRTKRKPEYKFFGERNNEHMESVIQTQNLTIIRCCLRKCDAFFQTKYVSRIPT
jgi:hypothetical protein